MAKSQPTTRLQFLQHPSNPRFQDLTGKVFGRLTVIGYVGREHGLTKWLCRCECGNEIYALSGNLKRPNHTESCGCRLREIVSKMFATHRATGSREYLCWAAMNGRCSNPLDHAYADYGGRGIQVCQRWRDSFEAFYEDMGPRPPGTSLDRFPDNNGNYEPGNCRWATLIQQMRNKRSNRLITIGTETHCITEWTEIRGLPKGLIVNRIRRGWSPEEAVLLPLRINKFC